MKTKWVGMLLVVITTATADDSFPDGSSSGSSSTASAAMLFEAVQYLRPLPESWSPNISLDQWEGVSVPPSPTCFHPGMPLILYAIVIVADDFSSNATLRLDLLDPMAPMCNITVISSSAASITVIMNVSHLPVTLQFLDVSETDVFTTSSFNNRYVDFAKMPTYLGYFDFSYTGIGGNLDLSLMGQTEGTEFSNFNATGNVGLVGGVDLTGAFGPNIDLRGTGISTVVVQASQQNIVGPSPSSGPDCTIFVDATVTVLPVTIGSVFLLEQGYYCMPPPNSSSEFPLDRGILNVYKVDGKNMLRMINPPYQCETPFDPLVTFNEGYVMNSTVLAMLLYPCVSLTLDYMQKLSNPGTQIGAIDAVTKERTLFGDCQYLEVGADAAYYSVTLSEDAFMDFNNTGYNVTARGYHESGELATCVFAWPLYINNPTWGTRNVIWNDRQLISDLAPCLPRRSGNITFSNWTSVTYLIPDSLILTDDEDRVLVLTTPSSNDVLVFTPFTYDTTLEFCLVTATFLYRWTVSAFSSTIVVANANNSVPVQTCTYYGILQHYAPSPGSSPNINGGFYAFDSMISALGPCLTMNDTTGSSNIWSNITSGPLFTDTTFTTMKSIQMFEDDGANYSFVANECVDNTTTTDVTGRWCSNVDFNTGSLILDVFPDRSAQLTYYRQSDKNSLVQLVTTCPASGYPLLFDNNGFVFSVSEVVYGWDPCLPRSTDKATFTPPVQSITYSASLGTITMVSADNVLLQLSKSVCGFDLPIKPADVVMCPELPGVAASASVNEVCIAGLCRPMKSVEWAPEAVASGGSSWLTGSAAVGTEILLESLAKPSNVDGGTITACYPQCFIDTSNCSQAAFFVSHILMCYVDRGEKVSAAELLIATFVNNSCSNASLLASISMMMEVNLFGGLSTVQPQCTHGGVALTRLYLNGSASIVLATSYGVTSYNTTLLDSDGEAVPGTVNNVAGLNARCTSCVSLWLQRLYPSPLILIAVNAVINVLLVFLANYFIQPLIGPRLVKLQALLSSILGSLSERDAEANEKWMLKCLKPYMATPLEIELHVDKVCSVVNAQRSTRNVVARNEEGDTSDVVEVQRTTSESESNEIEDAPTAPPTNSSIAAEAEQEETPNAFLLDADTVFRSILVEKIMGGRMLACASEASIARLVELRDCCELEQQLKPMPPKRSFRFPIGKKIDVDLVVMQEDETAQNLLEINNDEVELLEDVDDDNDGDETSKAFSQSQQLLEDMITAVVTDTTIEWQPYVFAEDWLDNEFLLTKDWMLALNAIMLLALMGKAAFVVDTSPTLKGSWEGYTEFYFLLLSGSTPVALLINAMIRVNYSKSFSASAVTNNRLALLYTALTDPFLMIPFMCILPALVTHIIPGLLIFPFLPVVGIALVAITMKIRTKLPNAVDLRGKLLMTRSFTTIGCIATRVMFRQVVMFVCFAGVQFAFSYMMMFYAARNGTLTVSSGSWWGIVEADFDARSTVCVLEQLKESVETSWNLVYAQFV